MKMESVCHDFERAVKLAWGDDAVLNLDIVIPEGASRRGSLEQKSKMVTERLVHLFQRHGKGLRVADLSRVCRYIASDFFTNFSLVPNIQHLTLTGIEVDGAALENLPELLPKLKSLTIRESLTGDWEDHLGAFLEKCKSLTSLDIAGHELNQDHPEKTLGVLPMTLKSLNIADCRPVNNAEVASTLHRLTKLESLNLSFTEVAAEITANLDSDTWKDLRELNLTGCSKITDEDVGRIANWVLGRCSTVSSTEQKGLTLRIGNSGATHATSDNPLFVVLRN